MNKKIVVCAHRDWNISMYLGRLSKIFPDSMLLSEKEHLSIDLLRKFNPSMIFFLDWSWIIKEEILNKFNCIGFHSAPLPEYRGGSPIQNQIISGITQTKLTAFSMDKGIDTGDILLQKPLSLDGHIMDIMKNISTLIHDMIIDIVNENYVIKKQTGHSSYYKRRKPSESELSLKDFEDNDVNYLYNFIRMLEDPYPNAFIKLANKKIIFKSAKKNGAKLLIEAVIEDSIK